jgi:hypothetical protein
VHNKLKGIRENRDCINENVMRKNDKQLGIVGKKLVLRLDE